MITYDELVELSRSTRGKHMLSAYLPGPGPDPASREAPRTTLESELSRIRHGLADAAHGEREAFLAASRHVLAAFDQERPAHAAGLAVFADERGVRHVGGLLESPAPSVHWRDGAMIAPYLATVARGRPAIVALVDSRGARVLRFKDSALELVDELEAEIHLEQPLHMGDAPRVSFHSGVRGETGTDEAERREAAAFDRMLGAVLHRIELATSPDLWLVAAGMPQSVRQLVAALPRGLSMRTELVHGLTRVSSDAEVARATSEAIERLQQRHDARIVEQVLDTGRAGNRASIGWRETSLALQERAASKVLLSDGFLRRFPDRAETIAGLAMEGRSRVEIVPGEGGARLDAESDGIAAEMRYPVAFESLAASGLNTGFRLQSANP